MKMGHEELFILTFLLTVASGLDNGLARTPPMGWMSWERYRCIIDCKNYPDECISEQLFKRTADIMSSEGYLEAGYEYIIIDDCWMSRQRDDNGRLQADPDRFPSGIKALADYVHGKGLKFGIYEDYGNFTCGGYPGIIGHLEVDAQTFADWEIDYVKLDGCYQDPETMNEGYPEFGNLLNQTGRPMIYSCSWPTYQEESGIPPNFELMKQYCNLWRNYDDIEDSWSSVSNIMDYWALNQDRIGRHAGPGHWNDPDMLIIGNFGLSLAQSQSQMAVWAIIAAPLLMSTDLANIKPYFKEILLNKDVIAISQDPLGIQGHRVAKIHDIEYWVRPIQSNVTGQNSYAVALVSRRVDGIPWPVTISLELIGLNNPDGYTFKDLYAKEDSFYVGQNSTFDTRVVPTGVKFYRADPIATALNIILI